jgi:transcriptional regulator with XRE-family HTH domain
MATTQDKPLKPRGRHGKKQQEAAVDPTPRIAQRLRLLRQQRGWSLEQLAQASGVSKAMLSKVERAEASPTAQLLGKLSGAFGLTLGALLADGDGGPAGAAQRPGRVARAAEQPQWRDPQTGYLRRQLSPPLSDLPMQLVEVRLPAGARVAFPAAAYAFIRQLVWVTAGSLRFTEGAVVHQLGAGDCLELGDAADCEFANGGRGECRYLVAVVRR